MRAGQQPGSPLHQPHAGNEELNLEEQGADRIASRNNEKPKVTVESKPGMLEMEEKLRKLEEAQVRDDEMLVKLQRQDDNFGERLGEEKEPGAQMQLGWNVSNWGCK